MMRRAISRRAALGAIAALALPARRRARESAVLATFLSPCDIQPGDFVILDCFPIRALIGPRPWKLITVYNDLGFAVRAGTEFVASRIGHKNKWQIISAPIH